MKTPVLRISEAARKTIQNASVDPDVGRGDALRLAISARFESDLYFDPRAASDVAVECEGLTILLDPQSASRADGVSIDFVDGANGGFKIDNPNKPGTPKQIELTRDCEAAQIPSGEKVQLKHGERVVVTQALGGSFTVQTEVGSLARIAAHDADALGFEVKQATLEESGDAGSFHVDRVMDQLKTVFDPEMPVNVVDLGLVYACEAHPIEGGGHRVEIKMSMTAPGCGMGDVLKEDARAKVQAVAGVAEVDVEIVWEPPWDKSRMSEAARLQLGIF
jgi:probable FeS assembly SUF system protein SufT